MRGSYARAPIRRIESVKLEQPVTTDKARCKVQMNWKVRKLQVWLALKYFITIFNLSLCYQALKAPDAVSTSIFQGKIQPKRNIKHSKGVDNYGP